MRLLRPNTTGFANFSSGAHVGFAEFPGGLIEGVVAVGLVSQSGALGLAPAQTTKHGSSLSHVLTCGNSADIDVADLVAFLSVQPDTRAIALVFERISDPHKQLDAVGRAGERGKPVVICKIGLSQTGANAVRWHTGTDPHTGFAWGKALSEAGAIVVSRSETVIETGALLAKTHGYPPPRQPQVAILSSSGGSGIIAAASAAAAGLSLALSDAMTRARLAQELPGFASNRNPCDATAQATSDPPMLTQCAQIMLSDAGVDVLVLPWGKAWDSGQFAQMSELAQAMQKPICLIWMSQWLERPGAQAVEMAPRLSLFRSMDSRMAALGQWHFADRGAVPSG